MRIVLIHPPHTAIGSRIPRENLPPFGLLCIGGPLIDAGHQVSLLNADPAGLSIDEILRQTADARPDAILIGHSGSTSAHPTVMEIATALKRELAVPVIYGGVYPSYHWREILAATGPIDVIVRGEGEETAVNLINALERGDDLASVRGIAFCRAGRAMATAPQPMARDLDQFRIAWELVDLDHHSYWGGKKAVILQLSRGCPHLCTYCGQRGFWTKWRYRNPELLADEIARLVRDEGVELINLADENPTSSRKVWRRFLEAIIAHNITVTIIGSTRADDIVRDADILHLYRKAGVLRFLIGMEHTDAETLRRIRKGGSATKDQEAIRLMRDHGMIALCTFAVGFADMKDRDFWRLLRGLLSYDPMQIMSIYATPHRWTPFFNDVKSARVIRGDLRHWDYKHQVVETGMPAWRVFAWVKFIEIVMQARPKALWRSYLHPDPEIRHAMRWYTRMGRRVFLRELWDFVTTSRRPGPSVAEYLGGDHQLGEDALARGATPANRARRTGSAAI